MPPSTHRIAYLGIVNAYLVEEDDGLTVIDTAMGRAHKAIVAAAAKLGKPIARIAITHGHADHLGTLDKLPAAEVSIPARDARIVGRDQTLDPGEPQGKIKGGWPKVRTAFDRLLEPGDGVGSLEVHAAPGHTPGQVAFFDPRDRTLYCGDAYVTLGGVSVPARANPRFPLPALATWDKPTALESARALRALDPAALAPGHGKVVQDPGAAMDKAIAKCDGA